MILVGWLTTAPAIAAGLLVEGLDEGSALAAAGVEPGDVIVAWERPSAMPQARGALDSPFDWHWLLVEQAPRGRIDLLGQRPGIGPVRFAVAVGDWQADLRLILPESMREAYEAGHRAAAAGDVEAAAVHWGALAVEAEQDDPSLASWLHLLAAKHLGAEPESGARARFAAATALAPNARARAVIARALGDFHAKGGRGDRGRKAFQEALAAAREVLPSTLFVAALEVRLARLAWQRRALDEVAERLGRARKTLQAQAPASLALADVVGKIGTLAVARGALADGQRDLERAVEIFERLVPGSPEVASRLSNLGVVARSRGELQAAEDFFARALAIQQEQDPESLELAATLTNLGALTRDRGALIEAEAYQRRALAIQEHDPLGGLDVTATLTNLGLIAMDRGALAVAERYHQQALARRLQHAPNTLEVAQSLNNLGILAARRGALVEGEKLHEEALAIQRKRAPDSLDVARSLDSLGLLASTMGDLERAEAYHREALHLRQALAPDGLESAASLSNLGLVLWRRGDLGAAGLRFEHALEIHQRDAPHSMALAAVITNLANIAKDRGDLETAERRTRQALAIQRSQAPRSVELALTLSNLGSVLVQQGDLDDALRLFEHAQVVQARLAPGGLDLARTLANIGDVHAARHRPRMAASLWQRALKIVTAKASGSSAEAELHARMATAARRSGQLQAAAQHARRAVDALEAQAVRLGGAYRTEARFRAHHLDVYRDYASTLIDLGQPARAFHIVERSRARSFLQMLAERAVITSGLPAPLAAARRELAGRYDRVQARLDRSQPTGSPPDGDGEEPSSVSRELEALRGEREDLIRRIRERAPRLASLAYPAPLELAAARAALDPGTVLLSYNVGRERTDLFVLRRDAPLHVATIALGQAALVERVTRLRALVAEAVPTSRIGPIRLEQLEHLARELFAALIAPAAAQIEAGERVVIAPDGPLHVLPWGALVGVTDRGGVPSPRHFIRWRPIHLVSSATVYGQLLGRPRPPRSPDDVLLVAFGDPHYPRDLAAVASTPTVDTPITDSRVRASVARGFRFPALPATRHEVEQIAALFPRGARTFLGGEATEERAKAVGATSRYLHFATHGLLDEAVPLDSAVALSMPEVFEEGRDNGLLQAWEILQQARFDADLVVLSACDSAPGKAEAGEGLIGLTRAFQYAGARSVVASLWSVVDDTTAALMTGFYRHLTAGLNKDEALRAAQLELIDSPLRPLASEDADDRDASAPYYWAAFQLYGDWR